MEHYQASAAVAAKSVATAGAAAMAFGLTPIAVAAAVGGALASLHFQPAAKGSGVWRVLGQIAAMAFLAAMLAVLTYYWFPTDTVPLPVRAGLLGIFASPCYQWAISWIAKKRNAGDPPAGG
jgi:hypothetical protein